MPELFDIYDENLKHIGVKPRSEVHRDGDWHKVFHCWVIYRDENAQDWMIIQKRAADKDTYPNLLDVSAAGHYEAGETVQDGLRELEEELGLKARFDDLIFVGRRVGIAKDDKIIDRQIAEVFLYICDQPLADYRYQKEELAGLVAINIDDGIKLFSGEVDSINVPAVGLGQDTINISTDDFVQTKDNYFFKAMILARRCLAGEKYLLI
jgi:isopentenyldiphosphate isomerase